MKKYISTIIISLITIGSFAQDTTVFMKIGKYIIYKDEFDYLYNKNKANTKGNTLSTDEYIDLFKKFKLKVIDAIDKGYDTVPQFKTEYLSYRNQLAVPLLRNAKFEQQLIDEAYRNLSEDVEIYHILLNLPHNYTNKDTVEVYQKALSIIKRLQKEPFSKVAKEVSQDVSVKDNGGYIGWFTGQMLVYPLEKAMVSMPIGEISAPIRTNYGYHIIKVTNRRPAMGKIQVAHILKSYPSNASKKQKKEAKDAIYNIYDQLKNGADFAKLASVESDDSQSAKLGGTLPVFGIGRMVGSFEQTAFRLKTIGELSTPIETSFGWHIIKLINRPKLDSVKTKADIVKAFGYDGRADLCKKVFIDNLKSQYGYKFYDIAFEELLEYAKSFDKPDSVYLNGAKKFNKTLFSISNHNVGQKQFAQYVFEHNYKETDNTLELTKSLIDKFIYNEILRYEDSQLDKKDDDFRHLVKEYRDGILLFNISNDMVWEKAMKDTVGLINFFNKNRKAYRWQQTRYKGYILYCKNKNIAQKTKKKLKKMSAEKIKSYISQINKDTIMIDYKRGIWQKGENNIIDNLAFGDKNATFEPTETYPYVFVVGKLIKEPENYRDVRPLVITDYQTYLEKEWIKELEKRYPISIEKQ